MPDKAFERRMDLSNKLDSVKDRIQNLLMVRNIENRAKLMYTLELNDSSFGDSIIKRLNLEGSPYNVLLQIRIAFIEYMGVLNDERYDEFINLIDRFIKNINKEPIADWIPGQDAPEES